MKLFTSEFLWSLYENDDRRQNIVWLFPLYWYKRRDAASRLEKGGPPFCSIFIRLWRFLYDRGKFFHHYTPSQESCLTLKKFIDALEYWRATISSHLSRIYGTRASRPFYFFRGGEFIPPAILLLPWQGSNSPPVMVNSAFYSPLLHGKIPTTWVALFPPLTIDVSFL